MSLRERLWWTAAALLLFAALLAASLYGGAKVDAYNAEHHPTHQGATP